MGNWNMTIQGVGPHGNGIEADIEQLYKKFVEDIKARGHTINYNSVTYGGAYFDPANIPPIGWKEAERLRLLDIAQATGKPNNE